MRVVKRGEYDEEVVRWADAIISAGGRLILFGFAVYLYSSLTCLALLYYTFSILGMGQTIDPAICRRPDS